MLAVQMLICAAFVVLGSDAVAVREKNWLQNLNAQLLGGNALETKKDTVNENLEESAPETLREAANSERASAYDAKYVQKRWIFDCVGLGEVCHLFQHCCGSLRCIREKFWNPKGRCSIRI